MTWPLPLDRQKRLLDAVLRAELARNAAPRGPNLPLLRALLKRPDATPQDLADHLGIPTGRTKHHLLALQRLGLVDTTHGQGFRLYRGQARPCSRTFWHVTETGMKLLGARLGALP